MLEHAATLPAQEKNNSVKQLVGGVFVFLFAVCFGGFLFGFFVLFQFWFVVFCCCWSGLVFCCCFWVSFLKFHSLHACFGAPKKWGVHTNELNTSHALKQSAALRRCLAQGSGEISGLQIL